MKGTDEYGLYPIVRKKGKWFLDKGKRYPMLGITRAQIPLAPAFAKTLKKAPSLTCESAKAQVQYQATWP